MTRCSIGDVWRILDGFKDEWHENKDMHQDHWVQKNNIIWSILESEENFEESTLISLEEHEGGHPYVMSWVMKDQILTEKNDLGRIIQDMSSI
jgi:hypothetical protein